MTGLVTIAVYWKPNKKQSLPSPIPRNAQASGGGEGGDKGTTEPKGRSNPFFSFNIKKNKHPVGPIW